MPYKIHIYPKSVSTKRKDCLWISVLNYIKCFITLPLLSAFPRLPGSYIFPVSGKPVYQVPGAETGAPLCFCGNTKKVTLTPEGEALLRHVEPAVNLLYEGENQLLNSPSVEAPLRIGASDTICRYFLVPYFQRFHREYPNIRIKVTNATSGGCVSPSPE